MKLNQLDGILAFVTVAKARSFTAAAAQLEVTPPAISQSVKQLEDKLGVRLLHRTTRSLSLTEAGERFIARVGPALLELNEAAQDLDNFREGPTGLLRLNAPHVVWEMYLRKIVSGFLLAYPGINIEMQLDDGFVDVAQEGFDAGIRLGESVQRDMVAVPFTQKADMCLVASPAYIQRCGLPQTLEELRHHACIRFRFRASKGIYRWELMRDGRLVEVEVDGPLTLTDSRSMRDAAVDGVGIAYVFKRQVENDMAENRLVGILPQHWMQAERFCLYYPTRQQMPTKLRAFIDYCKQSVQNQL